MSMKNSNDKILIKPTHNIGLPIYTQQLLILTLVWNSGYTGLIDIKIERDRQTVITPPILNLTEIHWISRICLTCQVTLSAAKHVTTSVIDK